MVRTGPGIELLLSSFVSGAFIILCHFFQYLFCYYVFVMSPCCRLSFAVVAAVTVFVVVVNSSASKGNNNNNSNESVDEIRTKTLLDDDVEIGKIVSIDCTSVCAGVCVRVCVYCYGKFLLAFGYIN